MNTNAFVTYMAARINGNLSRENILNRTNLAQNEILGNDNRITRIIPDPFIHTGSDTFDGVFGQIIGAFSYDIFPGPIPLTTPTQGYLIVSDQSGNVDRYHYVSYSGNTFTFADGVSLVRTYTTNATAKVDDIECIASGSIFSSKQNNRVEQYDVRKVFRVYAFRSKTGGWPGGYGRFGAFSTNNSSFRPDMLLNPNSVEIEVEADTDESLEAMSGDCKINFWRQNAPGNTADVYMCRAQRWPAQLLTEAVPLTIPDKFQTNLLRYAILRDVEYTEYGRSDNPETLYEKYLAEFLSETSVGVDTTTPTRTLPKEF
jgi:hypothetical protein